MRHRRRPGALGFTLIELLVACAIASFLGVGLWSMFKSNRLALALVDDIRNMEQNGRVGLDFMSRDLRKAGMGGQQNTPFTPYDNTDAIRWASANTGLTAKGHPVLPGTDIVEIFWGILAMPICLDVGSGIPGFNSNNANVKIPRMALMGLPGYDLGMSGQALGDLLNQYTVLVYDPVCPLTVNCTQNLTGGGWNSAGGLSTQLGYNRGQNTDDANHPHDCAAFDTSSTNVTCPVAGAHQACINIGSDQYYFVQTVEAGNAQLMRYRVGMVSPYEVISNYVEDFQMMYGVDGLLATDVKDGMVDSAEWINGLTYNTDSVGPRTYMARVYLLTKSLKEDTQLKVSGMKQNPPHIDNSTIAQPASGGDYYRRRLLTRTIRMRVRV